MFPIKNLSLTILASLLFGCESVSKLGDALDLSESAQQVGDLGASVDEMGGGSNGIAMHPSYDLFYKRSGLSSEGRVQANLFKILSPLQTAYAAACKDVDTFSSCSSNQITRSFGGCTVGNAVFNGSVDLTWGGGSSNCGMLSSGDHISREPNFTVTGLRGSTLAVSATGVNGQRLTWSSGSGFNKVFSFTNDGIRRTFTLPNDDVLFDFETETSSPITITGTHRLNRTIDGGVLKVTNISYGTECNLTPNAVTWAATCNCPVSGSWEGSCSDGKSYSVELTGCGSANLTYGSNSQSLSFDRCYNL